MVNTNYILNLLMKCICQPQGGKEHQEQIFKVIVNKLSALFNFYLLAAEV